MALTVYGLSAHLGFFETAWQEPQMSDSQFLLYESRRFLTERDPSALFSTWGSLVPVSYGAIALQIFGGHYLGIVFANSLLYTMSVFSAARLLSIPRYGHRFLPLIGLMPLQGLYNSMLAKEPIYLFLIVVALDAYFCAIASKRITWPPILVFVGLMFVTIVFRTTGAMIVGLVILFGVARQSGWGRALFALTGFAATFATVVAVANFIELPLLVFFLTTDGVDFSVQADFIQSGFESRQISASLALVLLPPGSIIASPLLGALWMVSPLPLMDNLIDAFSNLLKGEFLFGDLTVINRYLDATVMIALLTSLFVLRARVKRTVVFNPLVLFGTFQLLGIVAFQFIESGRHRYLPGFILAMFVIAVLNFHSKASIATTDRTT